MKQQLQFDFLVDKDKNTITVIREFAGDRQLVWDCYTRRELLDQWFAPSPFTTKTKSMDFKNGGHWHYAMVDTDGKEYWGYTEYDDIHPIDYYRTKDAFSDSEGTINKALPTATWKVSFEDAGENTLVTTVVTYSSLSDLETVINMGMKDGMTLTLEKLDALLLKLKK